jgi:hypothetical protein
MHQQWHAHTRHLMAAREHAGLIQAFRSTDNRKPCQPHLKLQNPGTDMVAKVQVRRSCTLFKRHVMSTTLSKQHQTGWCLTQVVSMLPTHLTGSATGTESRWMDMLRLYGDSLVLASSCP